MDLNPTPILMAIIIHANIGGCATPIGDPQNIIGKQIINYSLQLINCLFLFLFHKIHSVSKFIQKKTIP